MTIHFVSLISSIRKYNRDDTWQPLESYVTCKELRIPFFFAPLTMIMQRIKMIEEAVWAIHFYLTLWDHQRTENVVEVVFFVLVN